jgi:hypothetical protein
MMDNVMRYLQLPEIVTYFTIKNAFIHASLTNCMLDELPSLPHPNLKISTAVEKEMQKEEYRGYKMCAGAKYILEKLKENESIKHFSFISMYNKFIDDLGFRLIVFMLGNQKIEHINFTNCGITDYMLSLMLRCDFKYLKTLVLENNVKITTRSIINLLLFRNLNIQYLNISGTSVDKNGIYMITRFSVFKNLEFFHFNFKYDNECGIDGKWFGDMKELKRIVFRKKDVDMKSIPNHIQCVSTPFN